MGRVKKDVKLFLFDPITTDKKIVDYDYLEDLTEMSRAELSVYITKKKPLYNLGAFLCREPVTTLELSKLMSKWKAKEVKNEIWKDLPGGRTQVSSLGRFRNIKKDGSYRFLIISKKKDGHLWVKVFYNEKYGYKLANKLVAEAFVERQSKCQTRVCHKNSISYDNRANNLKWVTVKEMAKIAGKAKVNYISQIDCNTGEEVGFFNNILDAERKTSIKRWKIYKSINNNIPIDGFVWKREEKF